MQLHNKAYRRRLVIIFGVIVLVALVFIFLRIRESHKLRDETKEESVPVVSVVTANRGPKHEEIVLPGNVQAWHEAPIYARTNGYLKEWKTDIGTAVKQGDMLAEIDAPEIDAQLRQAEADLETAHANAQLAESTAKRWKALLKKDSVSKQEADEKIGASAAQIAAYSAAQANRDRLQNLESFKHVVAPFDGIVTARNTDTGALIANGNNGAVELFHIADVSQLRIYVQVPQAQAGAIKPDMKAELHFIEHPGKVYTAQLLKTADAIDPTSRTLLAQFVIDNPKNELLAGGYTEVHLKLASNANSLRLPVNTLLFRAEGLQVATLDDEEHVVLKKITLGRDFGNEVEVTSGLDAGEQVVINPPDSINSGDQVRIKKSEDDDAADAKGSKDEPKKDDDAKKDAK